MTFLLLIRIQTIARQSNLLSSHIEQPKYESRSAYLQILLLLMTVLHCLPCTYFLMSPMGYHLLREKQNYPFILRVFHKVEFHHFLINAS